MRADRRRVAPVPAVVAVVAVALALAAGAPPAHAVPGQGGDPAVTLPVPDPPPDDARRAADEILAGEAYQPAPPSIPQRIWEWILDRLPDLPTLPGPSGDGGLFARVLPWIVLVLLAGIVLYFLSRLRPAGLRRRRRRDADPLVVTESEALWEPARWIAEAERLEREGSWKEALRCRFRALVVELIERDAVRAQPGRTSGELRADIRRSCAGAAGAFDEATNLFDAAWYGGVATGAPESERFRRLAGSVLGTVPDHPDRTVSEPGRGDAELIGAATRDGAS